MTAIAAGVVAPAGVGRRRLGAGVPAWIELLLVVAALALLLPAFDRIAANSAGRDGRFAVAPAASAEAERPPATAQAGDAARVLARKDEAMRALLASAGWQWAGAMLLGYAMLVASRRVRSPALGVAAALACWAGAGFIARVPWPLAERSGFEPARVDAALASQPATFVVVLAVAALVIAVGGALLAHRRGADRAHARRGATQTMSSRLGYAGLVVATGVGFLLLLDLSANAHRGNRYLALYHQGHLWLGMMLFSVLLFVREPLGRGLGVALALAGEVAHAAARRLGSGVAFVATALVAGVAVVALATTLAHTRQLTSELGRIWLIVGAAWFFFLRAGPLAERLAHAGGAGASFWRYLRPLLLVVAVLVLAMFVTRDMGPLLIAGYAAGAFVAATAAMWWHLRGAGAAPATTLAALGFAAWIGATTAALFGLGSIDEVTAQRLESLADPFASSNDQLALVSWFQRAAPADGFGVGAAPWCGYAAGRGCAGVPAQIHSDYTFTAIVGVFGMAAAWLAAIGCAVWLHRLVRHHGRVTRGEPRLVAGGGHLGHDGQALLSWIGVAWVVLTMCQLAVTVAGNLAVLPLTGVTFPFVSFGLTSLLVNFAFLALCINVSVTARDRDG